MKDNYKSRRRKSRRICIALVEITCFLLIYTVLLRNAGDTIKSSSIAFHQHAPTFIAFQRSPDIIELEYFLEDNPLVGPCHRQVPYLPDVHPAVCRIPTCLKSPKTGYNIDLTTLPLAIITDSVLQEDCPPARGGQLGAGHFTRPTVSYIITFYNGVRLTMQCVLELFRTSGEVDSVEFILVNDGSIESAAPLEWELETLRKYFGISYKLVHNQVSLGYGGANNRGVDEARGEFIIFVNNDMMVAQGWLTSLMWTFQNRPKAGLVGPMFIGRNNFVQEAGGLVWDTGRAINVGRGVGINPFFNHLRNVDYISAACIMLRREVFVKLGKFDMDYKKGFYEDTDLSMAIAHAGLEVLFQPLAVVFHQEGSTFGTDQTSSLKRELMAANMKIFSEKWAPVLKEFHCSTGDSIILASRRYAYPNVLWVDDIVPEPDRDSGSLRMLGIMHALLSDGYGVSFLPTVAREPHYEAALRAMGVLVLPVVPVDQWLFQERGRCLYDVIYIARRAIFKMSISKVKEQCPIVPIIYDTVDLHFLREARDALSDEDMEEWNSESSGIDRIIAWLEKPTPASKQVVENRDLELRFIENADLTIVLSEAERRLIQHYSPTARLSILPNIYEVPPVVASEEHCKGRTGMLFVGNMNHAPNRQAVIVLIREILPQVARLLPEEHKGAAVLHVVGSNIAPDWLLELMNQEEGLMFHGQLPDAELKFLYSQVKVAVAPLLSGAGVKGKVAQALLFGVPIVVTPLAAEGMHFRHGENGLIGNTSAEFAEQVVHVLSDCQLWSKLVAKGRQTLLDHFSFERARPIVSSIFRKVGHAADASRVKGKCRSKRI